MSNYQNTSQHYGAPQGNSSQRYGSPQSSAPAPIRRNEATGSAPSDIPSTYVRTVRWVYILLAFFLGGFGVHNFYAGYHKRGVIQLAVSIVGGALTSGIVNIAVCVWVIYEMCVVKEDAKGVPFV